MRATETEMGGDEGGRSEAGQGVWWGLYAGWHWLLACVLCVAVYSELKLVIYISMSPLHQFEPLQPRYQLALCCIHSICGA